MLGIHSNVMSQAGGSVYIPLSQAYNESRIFSSRLTYDKGSAIIHNLRFEMQSDTFFFNTLKTYQQQFKDSFATGADMKAVAEAVCGRSFNDFFNQWYYGEGYPTNSVNATKQGDTITLVTSQVGSMPSITPFFKGWMEYKIKSAQGDTTVKVNHQVNNQTDKFYYTKTPTAIEIDPNNWVVNKNGTINLNIVTAISPVSAVSAGVKIYPKPTTNRLLIEMPATVFNQLKIFDVQGRAVYTQRINAGISQLKLNFTLPAGVYTVYLSGKKQVVADKIIVQ